MPLETIISSALTRPDEDRRALVLMGGRARTAYQVGVLQAIGHMLQPAQGQPAAASPFRILVGTSAGALNAHFLASRARDGLEAFAHLATFWSNLRSSQVYQLKVEGWIRSSRIAAALFLSQRVWAQQAFLNNTTLVDTLHKAISFFRLCRCGLMAAVNFLVTVRCAKAHLFHTPCAVGLARCW